TFKAGVNSFGWGGTNAHAVLEQYPALVSKDDAASEKLTLPLSAKSPAALKSYARAYANLLTSLADKDATSVCVATALVKAEFDHRHVFFAESRLIFRRYCASYFGDTVPLSEGVKVLKFGYC